MQSEIIRLGAFRRHRVFCRALASFSAAMFLFVSAAPAFAGSTSVLGGNAELTGMSRATLDANGANAAVFSSSSASAVLDWAKLNVGVGQSLTFDGASTTFFNLVDGAAGKSQIDGMINGSGNVWVINPAGIAFGAGSSVNVGGIFAAAAGNIENAAALRDGTAMTPAFSSFAGTVDASKGSFTADQVALMGKTVNVNGGDFSGAKGLSVAASAGAMTVDEVEGGRVSVNIADFKADDSEVVLGGLSVDGDMSVKVSGNVIMGAKPTENESGKTRLLTAVQTEEPIIQAGNIDIEVGDDLEINHEIQSTAGHVDVQVYGNMDVNADVTAKDYVSLAALGDVDINADVTSTDGSIGVLSLYGDVLVRPDRTVYASGTADIGAGYGGQGGSVLIYGNVMAEYGDVSLWAGMYRMNDGSLKLAGSGSGYVGIAASGSAMSRYANVELLAGCEDGNGIEVFGGVYSGLGIYAGTCDADIYVGSTAEMGAYGAGEKLELQAGIGMGAAGNVEIDGSLYSVGSAGSVVINSAWGDYSTGSIMLNGAVKADGLVQMFSGNGIGASGDIEIGPFSTDAAGNVIGGFVNAYGTGSRVEIVSGVGEGATGDVRIKGKVQSAGDNGSVRVFAGYGNGEGSKGSITIGEDAPGSRNDALVLARQKVQFNVYDGELAVKKGAGVGVTDDGSEVLLKTAMAKGERGDMVIDGNVFSEGRNGKVLLNAGYVNDAAGNITVGENASVNANMAGGTVQVVAGLRPGTSGNVVVNGDVTAADRVDVEAGVGLDENNEVKGGIGMVTIGASGYVAAMNEVKIATYHGDIKTEQGSLVETRGDGGTTVFRSGDIAGGEGSITIAGTVSAKGNAKMDLDDQLRLVYKQPSVSLFAAPRPSSQGGIAIEESGIVQTLGQGALIQIATGVENGPVGEEITTGGDIDIKGNVIAQWSDPEGKPVVAGSQVFVWGGYGDYTYGKVNVSGNVLNYTDNGQTKLWSARGTHSTGGLDVSGVVESSGADGIAYLFAAFGDDSWADLNLSGRLSARGVNGVVEATAGRGIGSHGDVFMSGAMDGYTRAYLAASHAKDSSGDLYLSGSMISGGYLDDAGGLVWNNSAGNNTMVLCGHGQNSRSKAEISGGILSLGTDGYVLFDGARGANAYCDLKVAEGGEVVGRDRVEMMTWNGNLEIDGTVTSLQGDNCRATAIALSDDGHAGNVSFGASGALKAAETATVYAEGSVSQAGSSVSVAGGRAQQADLPAAIEAKWINVRANGDVGEGDSNPLAVDGAVRAVVDGNASFAAARGEDFVGGGDTPPSIGDLNDARRNADMAIDDFRNPGLGQQGEPRQDERENVTRNGAVVADISKAFDGLGSGMVDIGGDLSVYTAGKLQANGLFSAGGNVTISAASFGDMSYLQAGGTLTINNVGKPAYPQIAYFESVNGREPKINNQPNDTVIFVDGRLAGGNLQIINKFGATEAFPVSTPELKSEQGIFGNPVFLHGDLDVANPMAVGNVDYMLQEIPRLTLASDFPLEVDKSVNTAGLNPKDVYRFGQHPQVAEEKPQAEQEEKKDDKASAEKPAEPKVAMR